MRSGRPLKTELYVVIFTNVLGAEFSAPIVRAERAYKRKLIRLGHLVLAGPWTDQSGGLAILRAESESAVHRLIEAAPFVCNGLQRYEVRPWRPVHGALSLRDEVVTSRLFAIEPMPSAEAL